MAHFYGRTKGSRGAASRLGGKKSGLTTTAASWSGAICVELRHDTTTGKDKFVVTQTPWHGCGVNETIASGTIGEPTPSTPLKVELLAALNALLPLAEHCMPGCRTVVQARAVIAEAEGREAGIAGLLALLSGVDR